MNRKKINIFGVTGSIGKSTLQVLREKKTINKYEPFVFSANENVDQLVKDCLEFKPRHAVIANESKYKILKKELFGTNIQPSGGKDALLELASERVNWSMSAIIGFAGVEVALRCAEFSDVLALANKEALVCAGDLLLSKINYHQNKLIPVDSEHSAIYQCLQGENRKGLKEIILTASGGPFRNWTKKDLKKATLKDALKHPSWDMGDKITIDSASMFNKSLELIEAMHLFNVPFQEIQVVIHPQSIIHSMVNFKDGTTIAQLAVPDMKGPIGYALNYPERNELGIENINFTEVGQLEFFEPDFKKFHSLKIVETVGRNLNLGVIFNAAKEIAVEKFISGEINFLDMALLVEKAINEKSLRDLTKSENQTFLSLVDTDLATREFSRNVNFY